MSTSIEVDTTSVETRVGYFFMGGTLTSSVKMSSTTAFAMAVESDHQLAEGLLVAAHKHGQAVGSVRCGGDAADWLDDADGDLTVVDQICDVGQGRGIEGDFFT